MSSKIAWTETANQVDSIESGGQKIEIGRYINIEKQRLLIGTFLDAYFEDDNRDYIGAEYSVVIGVLDLMTNIDIEVEGFDVELFIASGLWNKIKQNIDNYPQFEVALNDALEGRKTKLDSLSYVVDSFLSQISPLLQQISDIDFSDEKLNTVKELVSDFGKQINNTPVGEIIKEAGK